MPAPERITLARDAFLASVAFAMGVLLTLVFPTAAEFNQRTESLPTSAYSEAYLAVLARANPQDGATRIAWVKQLAGRGDFASALQELAEVPPVSPWKEVADDLGLDIAWTAARSFPEGSETRRQAFQDVTRRLDAMLKTPPRTERWLALANVALQLECPARAARFFEGVARSSEGQARADAWGAAGRWYLAAGEATQAASVFEEAAHAVTDDNEASGWINESLAAREATGRTDEAAKAAWKWAQARRQDPQTLAHAARLALAANQPTRARDIGRLLLLLNPQDAKELERTRERQALLELAAGDVAAAWPLIEEAVRRHPENVDWRVREARVAEWTGHPQVALQDWLLLSRQGRQLRRPPGRRP